jgi:hypothetical protein
LIWDIMSQVGALLKEPSAALVSNHPLQGFNVRRVFATGYSQTGFFLVTYINFIRPLASAHLDDGRPAYDGYLIGDGDGRFMPLNQCDESFEWGDPAMIIRPRPEPVISVVTQGNILGRQADSDSPSDRYRRYEVPGASHISQRNMDFSPSAADRVRTDVALAARNCIEVDQYGLTDFPLEYIMNGAFANLDAWVRDPQGYIPPSAPWIDMDIDDSGHYRTVLDGHLNATGGVRTPYLDVPIATYYSHSTPADAESTFMCEFLGYKFPLAPCVLMDLYPPRCFLGTWFCRPSNSYVPQVRDKVDKLVQDRLITADDGDRIKSEAETMQSQLPYRQRWRCLPTLTAPEPHP